MLRAFVIFIPILVALGCTMLALKVPDKGSAQDRLMRLLGGAFAIGLCFSGITWWQTTTTADQLAQAQRGDANKKPQIVWDTADDKGYEAKVETLTAQVNSLKAELAKQSGSAAPTAATTVTQQSSELPKIYWTQEDAGAGAAAVRFKIYGPLNIPAFVAICDRPCRATSGQIGKASEGVQVVGGTNKIAGYVFRKPRPIPAGSEGFIIIEPGGAKVTEFKILGESEIPEGMR